MRIHVTYKKTSILIPVDSGFLFKRPTIGELAVFIADRLCKIYGEACNSDESSLRIPELQLWNKTNTGYSLFYGDYVTDALKDDDVIIAVDYDTWMEKQFALCDIRDPWLKTSRDDYKDNKAKFAEVGKHQQNRIFVRLGVRGGTTKFELFSVPDLIRIGKREKDGAVIAAIEGPKAAWFVKACWVIENQTVKAIRVHVKSTSEKQTFVDQIDLPIDENQKFVKGPVTHISGNDKAGEDEEEEEVTYTLHQTVRTGPTIEVGAPIEIKTNYETEGSAAGKITLAQEGKTEVSSDCFANDQGVFNQYFINTLVVVNKSDSPVAIVKSTAQYEAADGQWTDAANVSVGTRYTSRWGNAYSWDTNGSNFNLDAKQTITVAFKCAIQTTGTPVGNNNYLRARTHPSLPQPLRIRLTVHDQDGNTASVVCEQANAPLDIETRESVSKSWNKEVLNFIYCDDVDAQTRHFAAVYRDAGNTILRFSYSQCFTYSDSAWKSLAFKATEAVAAEYELENLRRDASDARFRVWVLVDLERARCYGLKFQITTKSSSVIESVLLPQKKKGKPVLKAMPERVNPGAEVTVFWEVPECGSSDWVGLFAKGESTEELVTYKSTGDVPKGSMTMQAPATEGVYEFRYMPNNGYEHIAISNSLMVSSS